MTTPGSGIPSAGATLPVTQGLQQPAPASCPAVGALPPVSQVITTMMMISATNNQSVFTITEEAATRDDVNNNDDDDDGSARAACQTAGAWASPTRTASTTRSAASTGAPTPARARVSRYR